MKEWTVIWLPPIDGGDLKDSKIILDKFQGVYIWKHKHKPTDQVVYIGETDNFYRRVVKEEVNGFLKNEKWNIYDFDKEPDFAQMLKKYSFDKKDYMEVNKTKMIFIPHSQASDIWNRCWKSKVDDYIKNLQFLFCTGEWSFDQNKRRHIESKLLWQYKRYYAEKIGLHPLTKDNDRISIGKIQDPGIKEKIAFKHIGCIESIPERVLETLQ